MGGPKLPEPEPEYEGLTQRCRRHTENHQGDLGALAGYSFADEYHWKEGIGPRAERPVKVNTNCGSVEESNAVGTHEFFDLVALLGAYACVKGNLGSGRVQEMADWAEYLTSDSKFTLANLRRKHEREKPFKVACFALDGVRLTPGLAHAGAARNWVAHDGYWRGRRVDRGAVHL